MGGKALEHEDNMVLGIQKKKGVQKPSIYLLTKAGSKTEQTYMGS
jgi:hypothetical protein